MCAHELVNTCDYEASYEYRQKHLFRRYVWFILIVEISTRSLCPCENCPDMKVSRLDYILKLRNVRNKIQSIHLIRSGTFLPDDSSEFSCLDVEIHAIREHSASERN